MRTRSRPDGGRELLDTPNEAASTNLTYILDAPGSFIILKSRSLNWELGTALRDSDLQNKLRTRRQMSKGLHPMISLMETLNSRKRRSTKHRAAARKRIRKSPASVNN